MRCELEGGWAVQVIAATNPKGKYNASDSIAINTTLASPLLSRFDVVFVLRDTQNEQASAQQRPSLSAFNCAQIAACALS